ncbi:MAG: RHS repeat-associated core domain-containing protein [Flavobacteriaceae bacterium]|nr:RHS repeat-associated core domain-containing protein [Flavobacteriaceae bacterium]
MTKYENKKLIFFLPTVFSKEDYVSLAQIPEFMEVKKLSYVYNYVDHTSTSLSTGLGNIRLSYTEDPKHPNELIILEENNYYPFGLKHQDYNKELKKVDFWKYASLPQQEIIDHAEKFISMVPVVKGEYKYKYNDYGEKSFEKAFYEHTARSAEWQDELGLNVIAMDYRNYDMAIGRFMNPDALSEMSMSWSPYRFAFDNPVFWSDPTGLYEEDCSYCPDNSSEFKPLDDDWYKGKKDGKLTVQWFDKKDDSFTENGNQWQNIGETTDQALESLGITTSKHYLATDYSVDFKGGADRNGNRIILPITSNAGKVAVSLFNEPVIKSNPNYDNAPYFDEIQTTINVTYHFNKSTTPKAHFWSSVQQISPQGRKSDLISPNFLKGDFLRQSFKNFGVVPYESATFINPILSLTKGNQNHPFRKIQFNVSSGWTNVDKSSLINVSITPY